MSTQNDVDKLMTEAQKQLDEHKMWLKNELIIVWEDVGSTMSPIIDQVDEIKLRMARAETDAVSILWEYPEELLAYLRDPSTPEHLRKTLEGGRVVDMEQPGFSAKRAN